MITGYICVLYKCMSSNMTGSSNNGNIFVSTTAPEDEYIKDAADAASLIWIF